MWGTVHSRWSGPANCCGRCRLKGTEEAETFLTEQWPPQPPIRMSQEEYVAAISKALKNVKQPDDVEIEQIQRRIEEQYALIEEMQRWLDNYLKD
jgi:hypothetical protein